MPSFSVIVCDSSIPYEGRSVFMSAPTNHIACTTSDGVAGNLKAVQVDLADASLSYELQDTAHYAAIWSVGFGAVMASYLIGAAIGSVLEFIRKG